MEIRPVAMAVSFCLVAVPVAVSPLAGAPFIRVSVRVIMAVVAVAVGMAVGVGHGLMCVGMAVPFPEYENQ